MEGKYGTLMLSQREFKMMHIQLYIYMYINEGEMDEGILEFTQGNHKSFLQSPSFLCHVNFQDMAIITHVNLNYSIKSPVFYHNNLPRQVAFYIKPAKKTFSITRIFFACSKLFYQFFTPPGFQGLKLLFHPTRPLGGSSQLVNG